MSSLLSIISAGRKRNLLGGLVDWWDSGLTNGQHSGIAFTNAAYSLTTDPFGGSLAYYAVAGSDLFRPGLPTSISALNPWTVACVFYKGAGISFYTLSQSGGNSPSVAVQPDESVFVQNWFEQAGLGTIAPAGTVTTGWHSFVTSYANGVVNFYLDGVLIATRSVSHTTATWQPAFAYFFRLGDGARCAVGAIATRAWSLGDAISFHNSGSFKRYRDFSGFEPETNIYLARIVAAGSSISSSNLGAVNTFVAGCKTDGIWNAIKASCLLAGADTLAGALIPLVGAAPTNVGGFFVTGDYSRTTGLIGNGSTKYLNSNRSNNSDPQNNQHLAVYQTEATAGTLFEGWIGTGNVSARSQVFRNLGAGNVTTFFRSRNDIGSTVSAASSSVGLKGLSRSISSSVAARANGSNYTLNHISAAPTGASISVFGLGASDKAASRLSFYSIGESLDLALLDARLATYMSSLT
jgi:hypothetical protein